MNGTNLWDVVAAIGSVAAAVIAWRAIGPAKQAIELANDNLTEARKARRVTLALELSERYSGDEMHKALDYLAGRRNQYGKDTEAMAAAYAAEVRSTPTGQVAEWSGHRRRVSKFFVAARAMCVAELLDESILAEQLQSFAFDLYVDTVAPLDEAHSLQVMRRPDFDNRTCTYFRDFRKRHFGRRDA